MANFTHLHLHTNYSLLDGSGKIKEMIARCKELGMDSMAITDHGVLFGVVDFYKEALANDIKPIIGCEVYITSGSRFDKAKKGEKKYYHLILLAKNNTGYKNLMRLVSDAFIEGFYYKPRIDKELLEQFHEGLICSSACLGGEIPSLITSGQIDEARELAIYYDELFGRDNFYLELQDHGYEAQANVNKVLIEFSKELGIPLIATNDVHYTYPEDATSHDILLCIQTNKKIYDEDRMRYEGGQFYLKSPQEMEELFYYCKEALENTNKIADMCNVEFEFGTYRLPKFYKPIEDKAAYLRELCEEGLAQRYNPVTDELKNQLSYELKVISDMGFVDYFLITWDFIKYAKEHDIMVGPGRGSAAGSLVAYCLDITEVDPIKYDLLFERFLNPERITMPDIDIDFCYERRSEVIDYVIDTYGEDRVAQIITFGTMATRAVIRDVGRALDMPYADVDKVAKLIPSQLKMTIDKALAMSEELKNLYDSDEDIKYLIDMAKRLEGLKRHSSTHAAGVVVCDKPVHEYVPLNLNDDIVTTQFPMTTLEELGLLKMDFLGLRTLTVIRDALENIEKFRGKKINIKNIDFDDKATYELISSGNTDGVFQLESDGMKVFIKELKPANMEDIIAGISLYRPGPMDFIPEYIKNRANPENVVYDCPELEPILKKTYGVIVYQEQVMEIVRSLAGYSYGRSDMIRRAMSKKKHDVMEHERVNFIYGNPEEGVVGAKGKGIDEKVANKLFDKMIFFAEYAFNKSHAAAYGLISYQTAWLKAHYPVEYMAALLTSVMHNTSKVTEYIVSMKEMGIDILPPDINEGFYSFSVSGSNIRFGLAAVKNVGRGIVENIVMEREKNGKFTSFTDFIKRMLKYELNKRVVENLIVAGAFDSLGATRKTYMQNFAMVMEEENYTRRHNIEGQINLFEKTSSKEEANKDRFKYTNEYPNEYRLAYEKEVMGIYLSGHPLDAYVEKIKLLAKVNRHFKRSIDLMLSEDGKYKVYDGEQVYYVGIVESISIKATRTNKTMAFVNLEDLYGSSELVVFPKILHRYRPLLEEDKVIVVKGKISTKEDQDGKILVDTIYDIDDVFCDTYYIAFENMTEFEKLSSSIEKLFAYKKGKDDVVFFIREGRLSKKYSGKVLFDEDLLSTIKRIVGEENVKSKPTVLKI